jgi:predicted transcriptional regulator YdeE
MKEYIMQNDVKTFGKAVPTFPLGIDEVFNELMKKTGDAAGKRDYYGISEYKNGKMHYYAVAAEKSADEGKRLGYETFIIDKGEYLADELTDWQNNTQCIKDIFTKIIQDETVDTRKPAIEWYKNDHEMLCMVMIKK